MSQSPLATRTDLVALGVAATALTNVSTTVQDEALAAATSIICSYLRERFTFPITVWGRDIRRACCVIAAYDLMVTRGYQPSAGQDDNLRQRYEDVMTWLRDIARGIVIPEGVTDATPSEEPEGGTYAVTNRRRRWMR